MPEISRARKTHKASLNERVVEVFSPDGPLARALPHFESRPGQVEMARTVADAFEQGGVVLAEAGTGTGKTLAYLVPAVLSGGRVLISTGTKNLQEQIYFKDIPALRDALGINFTATYMKGRANYLCLHRLEQLVDGQSLSMGTESVFLPMIQEWSAKTETGDRAELEDLPEDLAFWNSLSATAETCLGTECTRYDECFITRMRQRAAESDVVVVNHHLLCADASVRQNAYGEVIPSCAHAIIDEAHQLEDVATQYFGYSVSTYRVEELARDIERAVERAGTVSGMRQGEVPRAIERLRDRGRAFFADLELAHREVRRGAANSREERVRVTTASLAESHDTAANLIGTLDLIESTLALMGIKGGDENNVEAAERAEAVPTAEDFETLAGRAAALRDEVRFLLRANDSDFVFFVEFRGRGVFFRASPIDVSKIVQEVLFDRMRTTVLTSATLAVDGRFDYIRERLGIGRAHEVRLPSEFDFSRQALLYLPARMPDPRSPEFAMAAGREVVEILRRSKGRAFVLFTSYAMLREVQAIAEMALDYPLFVQGTAPRSQLLRQFRETPHSVLLATSSFWQGVDVVGDQLSCVIIDKLPFASPADPVTGARIESIRARGGEPFDGVPGALGDSDASTGAGPPNPSSAGPRRPGRARPPTQDQGLRPAFRGFAPASPDCSRPISHRSVFFRLR